ncbi:Mce-associated membrane protein [Rhodococcus triatomae]|uniref:Mce-associated membrane protein n=1 Tax=Rhodococcus triatomae TaxID=300028 RepID=A0A1G8B9A6_9NOCA|nr:Mce-associated membrane protein [Rhodococcus triatomae]
MIACVVVVALVAVAALLALGLRADDARDARRQAYVDAARQTILNLTTIHPDTAREDVDRLLAGASGEFAQEFEGRADPFVSVVADARVATEGEVIVAGLETETDSSATVLVAARAIVSSADQPEPSPRDFRMRVTITDTDGELTASRVEFVP